MYFEAKLIQNAIGGGRGGRGGGRGGGAAGGKGGAPKVILEPHRHAGVFIAKGAKESLLVTKNLVPGESVYGEKRISIEGQGGEDGAEKIKTEYRVWNPFRSKLAAGILGGLDDIYIAPGKKVLYLGAASGTSVSHVADVVGPVSERVDEGGLCLIDTSAYRKEPFTLSNSLTAQDVI